MSATKKPTKLPAKKAAKAQIKVKAATKAPTATEEASTAAVKGSKKILPWQRMPDGRIIGLDDDEGEAQPAQPAQPSPPVLPVAPAQPAPTLPAVPPAPAAQPAPAVPKARKLGTKRAAAPTLPPVAPAQPAPAPLPLVPGAPVNVAAFPPFVQVQTNIKGRLPTEPVPLGTFTVVWSALNRAGKTAVLDAIGFALHGAHPVGSDYEALCSLTADGSTPVAAVVSSGGAVGAHIEAGKKKVSRYTIDKYALLPPDFTAISADTSQLPFLSEAKLRDALFARFGGGVTAASELLAIPAFFVSLKDGAKRWADLLGPEAGRTVVERLLAAREDAASEKRNLQAVVRHQATQVEALGERVKAIGVVSPDMIAQVETALAEAEQAKQLGGARFAYAAAEATIREKQSFLLSPSTSPDGQRVALAQYAEWIRAAEAWIAAQQPMPIPHAGLRAGLTVGAPCPVCESVVQVLPARESPEVQAAQVQLASVLAARDKVEGALAAHESATKQIAEAQAVLAQLGPTIAKLASVPERSPEEINELRARLTSLRSAAALMQEWQTAQDQAQGAELLVKVYRDADAELSKRLSTLVGMIGAHAAARIAAYLPAGFGVRLEHLTAEGEPTCRWQVRAADGAWRPYALASGVERATARVALACAWAEALPLRVLLLDDEELGAFNDQALIAFVARLAEAVQAGLLTQVVIATSRPALEHLEPVLPTATLAGAGYKLVSLS